MGLDYEVQYKKGAENKVADALSRKKEEDPTLNDITAADPTWMKEIELSYEQDSQALQLNAELITAPNSMPNFSLSQGILRHDHRIYVGKALI